MPRRTPQWQLNQRLSGVTPLVKQRRYIIIAGAVLMAVVVTVQVISLVQMRRGHSMEAQRIVEAAHAFVIQRTAQGAPLPDSISLTDLVQRGFLLPEHAAAFGAADVRISLKADRTSPRQILIEASLPDGTHIVALADGSAGQKSK